MISKIMKLDENNQHGYAMTKLLPTSFFKKQRGIPSLKEFNQMIENAGLEGKTGHIMVAGITFDEARANAKILM